MNRLARSATFRVLDGQGSLLDICWREIQNFANSHSSSGHQLQHEPIPYVCGPEDDLIDGLLVDDIPLNSMRALKNLSDDRTVAGISEGGKPCVDTEIVKGCQNRVAVPFCGLSVILGQGKEKLQEQVGALIVPTIEHGNRPRGKCVCGPVCSPLSLQVYLLYFCSTKQKLLNLWSKKSII